ncbi:MAG: aminotransferase class IV [Solirubrobacteraceae bacterium]
MSALRPDPALGVFETLLALDGRILALDRHLHRLQCSTRDLYGLALPDAIVTRLRALGPALAPGAHRVRVDAIPRDGRLDCELSVSPGPPAAPRPVALAPLALPGGLGAHKWRDRRLLDRPGGHKVPLLVDEHETVLEAAWANVWIVESDRLITPPADGRILPGVTRARLLALAPEFGFAAAEEPVSLARAAGADGVLLTSSVRLATPATLGPRLAPTTVADQIRAWLQSAPC